MNSKELLNQAIESSEWIADTLEKRKETEAFWREQIAQEIEAQICNSTNGSCWGVNGEHCDTVRELAAIARGQK